MAVGSLLFFAQFHFSLILRACFPSWFVGRMVYLSCSMPKKSPALLSTPDFSAFRWAGRRALFSLCPICIFPDTLHTFSSLTSGQSNLQTTSHAQNTLFTSSSPLPYSPPANNISPFKKSMQPKPHALFKFHNIYRQNTLQQLLFIMNLAVQFL